MNAKPRATPSPEDDVASCYPAPVSRRLYRRALILAGLGLLAAGSATWLLLRQEITYVTAPVTGIPGDLKVPSQALLYAPATPGGGAVAPGLPPHVWVLHHDKPTPIPVTFGVERDGRVSITSGPIQAGDQVIVAEHTPHPRPNRR